MYETFHWVLEVLFPGQKGPMLRLRRPCAIWQSPYGLILDHSTAGVRIHGDEAVNSPAEQLFVSGTWTTVRPFFFTTLLLLACRLSRLYHNNGMRCGSTTTLVDYVGADI